MDRDFQIWETKTRLFKRDGYTCRVCGKSIYICGRPMLGHLIKQNEMYLRKYGREIIFHDNNMVSVCSGACNAAVDLGHKTKLIEDLAKKIRKKLNES